MYGRGPPGYPPSGPSGYRDAPPHGYGGGGPGGSYQGVPTGPRSHAGLGAPGAPSSLPRPPNLPPTPAFGGGSPMGGGAAAGTGLGIGEKFSLFVGSIAEGVENGWLERILGVAGPVLSFRRPSPPFAFVEYSDPESVLRCLEVVNGAKIMGKNKEEKALLVKADEKTRARLDEYEQGRVHSETNADLTQQARDDLSAILARIAAGDSLSAAPAAPPADSSSNPSVHVPNHLKDLAPEDLPENQRENTLSSIALFRERAMKKAQEKKERERQIEERRKAMIANKVQQRPTPTPPTGATMSEQAGSPDPQSFNKPMSFVQAGPSAGSPVAQPEPEIDDARRERERAEREHRQAEAVFRDRERRYEQRERARIAAWERERARERSVAEQEDHDRSFMAERLATWDDDREAERGRESSYTDRIRWRAQRKPLRMREQEADARDRALEAQHLAAVAEQSNSFLSQHADLFASALQQPGTPNAAPSTAAANGESPAPVGETSTPTPGVKLSFGAGAAKPKQAEQPVKRPAVLGMAEDDEEGRRKRELIPLSYSDDEDEAKPKARLSRREAEEKTREVEGRVPSDKVGLWGWKVRWKSLNEDIIKHKIAPFANQCIVEYLGGEEAELLNAVTEHLRAHKPAQELVEELEPVLDEEANDLVVKVWRVLVLETELAHAGVSL